jgi:hypothetical protein
MAAEWTSTMPSDVKIEEILEKMMVISLVASTLQQSRSNGGTKAKAL